MKNFNTILLVMALGALLGLAACSSSTKTTETTTPAAPAADAPASSYDNVPEHAEDATNKVTGTFVSLEMGDYMHFNMKSDAGEDLSFFVMDISADQISPFEQGGMEGKKVEVQWQKVKRDIPEAGGEMEIEEVTAITILE